MEKSIIAYIMTCNDDVLYEVFEFVVEEINRRKAKEQKENE
jgi:hypothetical protein